MGRSSKKGYYVDEKLLKKVLKAVQTRDKRPIKTWSRRSTITPEFVGISLSVYNGRKFIQYFVTENMVGHRVGEFAPTRIFKKHSAAQDKAKAAAVGQKT